MLLCASQQSVWHCRRGRWHDPPGLHPRLAQIPLRAACSRAHQGLCVHTRTRTSRLGSAEGGNHHRVISSPALPTPSNGVRRCCGGSCCELGWSTEGVGHMAWGVARRIKRGYANTKASVCDNHAHSDKACMLGHCVRVESGLITTRWQCPPRLPPVHRRTKNRGRSTTRSWATGAPTTKACCRRWALPSGHPPAQLILIPRDRSAHIRMLPLSRLRRLVRGRSFSWVPGTWQSRISRRWGEP